MAVTSPIVGRTVGACLGLLLILPASAQERLLEREKPHEWTLDLTINVRSCRDRYVRDRLPVTDEFNWESMSFVFPVIEESAGHRLNQGATEGVLTVGDEPVDDSMTIMRTEYHSGARLARWECRQAKTTEAELKLKLVGTCYETSFDEAAASQLDWPSQWPPEAASTFEPQYYIDLAPTGEPYDMEPIRRAVEKWTNGKDPKSIKPTLLAKYLAGEVWTSFQPSGNGLDWNKAGQLQGIDLQGAPLAARRGRGSPFDMVTLLAAVYREAGLPARTIIGYDTGKDDDSPYGRNSAKGELRAWVEFGLYDERTRQLTWVPVDVVRMRKATSRPPDLEQPWKFFGSHDELDTVIPFAFQFHPPTTVVSYGAPAFWGWFVTPEPPSCALQGLSFVSYTTPKRGGDQQDNDQTPQRRRRN